MTDNLNLPQLAQAQNNKHVTINDQAAALDAAMTSTFILEVDDTNTATFTEAKLVRLNILQLEPASAGPTGVVTVNVPPKRRGTITVFNNLSVAADVRIDGGQPDPVPTIASGDSALVVVDGSNVRAVAAATASDVGGGGGASSLDELSDVDTATSGSTAGDVLEFNGSNYVPQPRAFDLGWYRPGKPGKSALVLQFVAPRPFTLPINLSGSVGYAGAAPADDDKVLDIQKNGSTVGAMTFANGSNTAVFSMPSQINFAPGDRLQVVAPSTQDSSMADVSATFKGTKQ